MSSLCIHPVILCGGAGTRLWPLSRRAFPKQFSPVVGTQSLFQGAVARLEQEEFAPPIVVTGVELRHLVREQLAALGQRPQAVLIEPSGRNTAPAVLAAAMWLAEREPDALLLVTPSDQVISDDAAFRQSILRAASRASAGDLVTFGITPTRPEVGYGYLELEPGSSLDGDAPVSLVRLIEKPEAVRAAEMVASGNYLWNAGIFLFSVEAILDAFRRLAPEIFQGVEASLREASYDRVDTHLGRHAWDRLPNISIDYAVMEHAPNLAVMPFPHGWSDLGGWEAVWQASEPDADGNAYDARSRAFGCRGSLLRSEHEDIEVIGIGLEDLIVVAMRDAVLVAKKDQCGEIKHAVADLEARGRPQATTFARTHHAWGHDEPLAHDGDASLHRYQVRPGGALDHVATAAEHWYIVEGHAELSVEDVLHRPPARSSFNVAAGARLRWINTGDAPLRLLRIGHDANGGG